jgi:hypothetical protein
MNEDHQTCTTKQENFKKITNFDRHAALFNGASMGQLHRDFLRFVDWSRTCGRWGNFYRLTQGQHPLLSWLLCALSTAESLSCPKSIGSIGGSTIFQSQQYSSCPKAGGCWAAQLLGGFRTNLLIVSWATPTPGCTMGCTANFPGNWSSQQLILLAFGRSA